VNLSCGTLTVGFDSISDLEQRLAELDPKALERSVATHLGPITTRELRKVKPALEGICQFRHDGTLEFLRPARSKLDAIGIILHAYDPDPVAVDLIGTLSAEKNPAAYMLQKKYAKLFLRPRKGLYALSHVGREWVSGEVIPGIRKEA
jgi:hypothetical protein